jgi:hypothetical protein
MSSARHGVNVINAGESAFLLVGISGGDAVHLAGETPQGGREAVPEFWLDDVDVSTIGNYDRAVLLQQRWSEKTLCGRVWAGMVGHDGESLTGYDVAFAPTCRRCMASMDRHFPKPQANDRLGLVAKVTADLVGEHGYAEVHHVPGDQQGLLRSAVRSLVRKETGHSTSSLVHDPMVIFTCEAIYDLKRDEHSRAAVEAIGNALFGDGEARPVKTPDWRISWNTWAEGI